MKKNYQDTILSSTIYSTVILIQFMCTKTLFLIVSDNFYFETKNRDIYLISP